MNLKSFLVMVLGILLSVNLSAQDATIADLIKRASTAPDDSSRVKLYNDVVWEYMYADSDSAMHYAHKALQIAEKTGNKYSLSDCYHTMGSFYYILSEFEQSIRYHEKALAIRLQLKDKKALIATYNNLGSSKKELGKVQEEIDYYYKALKLIDSLQDTLSKPIILNNISDAFLRQGQFEKSEQVQQEALQMRLRSNDLKGQVSSYLNLANIYYKQQKYEASEAYYEKAYAILRDLKDNYILAKYHTNYAALLKDTRRPQLAITHIQKGIAANNVIGNHNSNLVNYINLAAIYEALGKVSNAQATYKKVLELAIPIGSLQWQRQANLGLATTNYALKNYKPAYEYLMAYHVLKDSLAGDEVNKVVNEIAEKYESEKKATQIQLLEQQKEIDHLQLLEKNQQLQKRSLLLIASGVIIILLMLSAYFYYSRQKARAEQERQAAIKDTEEKERLRLAKDIHDDLGSGLAKIKFISEVLISKTNDNISLSDNARAISETAVKLVDNMRDLIWALNPVNTDMQSLIGRIREYAVDYISDFPLEISFDIDDNIPNIEMVKEAHRNLFFIVKESLQNIIKHAQASTVEIEIKQVSRELRIRIADNGTGLVEENKLGNGLFNSKSRMEAIGGTYTIQSNKEYSGTLVEVTVPVEKIQRKV